MKEAAELGNYLPLSFKSPKEQEYIAFLWDAFQTNYTHGKAPGVRSRSVHACSARVSSCRPRRQLPAVMTPRGCWAEMDHLSCFLMTSC